MPPRQNMEPEMAKKIEDFRKEVTSAAEHIVFDIFPEKILYLQSYIDKINSPSSDYDLSKASSSTDVTVYPPPSSFTETQTPSQSKRRKLSTGEPTPVNGAGSRPPNDTEYARYPNVVLANKHLRKIHLDMKKEYEELVQLCDKVKLWVNLTMPKIEDGDNLGVQIQEEALSELHRAQETGYNLRDASRTHHIARGKLCSKLIKYPGIEDYAIALEEHDEKQLYVAKQHISDLRNVYAILTDILHKNIQKIRAPKGNNSSAMY